MVWHLTIWEWWQWFPIESGLPVNPFNHRLKDNLVIGDACCIDNPNSHLALYALYWLYLVRTTPVSASQRHASFWKAAWDPEVWRAIYWYAGPGCHKRAVVWTPELWRTSECENQRRDPSRPCNLWRKIRSIQGGIAEICLPPAIEFEDRFFSRRRPLVSKDLSHPTLETLDSASGVISRLMESLSQPYFAKRAHKPSRFLLTRNQHARNLPIWYDSIRFDMKNRNWNLLNSPMLNLESVSQTEQPLAGEALSCQPLNPLSKKWHCLALLSLCIIESGYHVE